MSYWVVVAEIDVNCGQRHSASTFPIVLVKTGESFGAVES